MDSHETYAASQRQGYESMQRAQAAMQEKHHEMRCMFACWAPQEIPRWFKVDVGERPDPIQRRSVDAFGDPMTDCINQAELDEWDEQASRTRYFSWRWYFADQMMAWRNT
jgi:hypothetical protein